MYAPRAVGTNSDLDVNGRCTMWLFRSPSRRIKLSCLLAFTALWFTRTSTLQPAAAGSESSGAQETGQPPQSSGSQSPDSQSSESQPPVPQYDKAIFQKPIPSDQLAFLSHFDRMRSGDAIRDKQYRKLLHNVVPDCIFHYGTDMSLSDAIDMVLKDSSAPVQVRDGRYVIVSGRSGPYLMGRGFLWIDVQDGIGLGAFYFHPTNGEPTPVVIAFSRQVKEKALGISQLPPVFAQDLTRWSRESYVPPVTTRYFITGSNEKILLEHNEDYCQPADGTTPPPDDVCLQMNADASDLDVNAAYYLEQINHATNGTAWMIPGDDQVAWVQIRDETCRVGPDPLRCHIRMTRERTHVIVYRHPIPHSPHR